jgi:hypothetical protein
MTAARPVVTESLNIIKFDWENGLSIELHNLNDAGKSQIWTRYSENGSEPILVRPQDVNILAERTLDAYCKRLERLTPGLSGFDYSGAFDWIVPLALQVRQRGEPVIDLGLPNQEIKRPSWDAYPFVVSGMESILFGDRGSLKSKFALMLALIMMLPMEENELGIIAPKKPLLILKLDFEATQESDDYEWHRMLRGLDIEGAVQLKYRACRRPLADDIESISNHANNVKANVLLIDSLGPAAGGDLNASEPALRFNHALRELQRSSIVTAHTSKNMLGKRSVFGSIFYENMARNIWEVTKEEDEDTESKLLHIALRQTKSPPFSPHHKPMAYEFDFDEDAERTIVKKYDPNKMEVINERKSNKQKILEALKSDRLDAKKISESTGIKQDVVRETCRRLKEEGKIIKIGEDWGIVFKES